MNRRVITDTYYSFSQIGQKENQEDYRYPNPDTDNHTGSLFMVCDGVGGYSYGEVASQTVCDAFAYYFQANPLEADEAMTEERFEEALAFSYSQLDKKAQELGTIQMATTLTFALFHKKGCFVAHIGDSRIYLIRPTDKFKIKFKTSDHSYLNEQEETLSEEEIEQHPMRHVITRSMQPLQGENRCKADTFNIDFIQPGDYLFLCSDGVLEKVNDPLLTEILSSNRSDLEKIEEIETRCEGSYDNYTALLIPVSQKKRWWQLW